MIYEISIRMQALGVLFLLGLGGYIAYRVLRRAILDSMYDLTTPYETIKERNER